MTTYRRALEDETIRQYDPISGEYRTVKVPAYEPPKPAPRHIPRVGIPSAPQAGDLEDDRTVGYEPMPGTGYDTRYTAYAPQAAPKPGDQRRAPKPKGMKTGRAPQVVPATDALPPYTSERRAARRDTNYERKVKRQAAKRLAEIRKEK